MLDRFACPDHAGLQRALDVEADVFIDKRMNVGNGLCVTPV